jgi:hypothetical protein
LKRLALKKKTILHIAFLETCPSFYMCSYDFCQQAKYSPGVAEKAAGMAENSDTFASFLIVLGP